MKNKSDKIFYIVLFLIIGISIACYFIFKESDEDRNKRVIQESTERLRKADDRLEESQKNYNEALNNITKTQEELEKAQEETGININDVLKQMGEDN